jgi:pyridoxal phosphate enzyme (YggS family)
MTTPGDPTESDREAALVAAVGSVRARIAAACEAAGREPQDVTLVAITKTYPATDVVTLARLGVLDVGENKDQEARAKVSAVAELTPAAQLREPLRWHMVGQLQSKKARSVVAWASSVHSVDRPKLVHALAEAAQDRRDVALDVFVQISLDDEPGRGGVPPAELLPLADAVAERADLRLRGVMAVAPLGGDPDSAFATLAAASARLRERYPDADAISAGMSGDLEAAIRHGSTHVRVGTALLGRRAPAVG